MYHLKKDVRAERSAEKLFQGLMEVLKNKEISKATVTDVSKAAGVGRATFYRNFDNIEDLIAWKCSEETRILLEGCRDTADNFRSGGSLLSYVLTFLMTGDRADLIEAIIKNKRLDFLHQALLENGQLLQELFRGKGIEIPDRAFEYFYAIYASFLAAVIHIWVEGGRRESAEEITDIVRVHDYALHRAGVIS